MKITFIILIGLLLSLVLCIMYAALVVASEADDKVERWAYDETTCDDSICSGDCDSCEIRNRKQQ